MTTRSSTPAGQGDASGPAPPMPGAVPAERGTRFCVLAPAAREVEIVVEPGAQAHALAPGGAGYFSAEVPGVGAGTLYRCRVDGALYPDPASRFQPDGVHGPSMVIDPRRYAWDDARWPGAPQGRLVFYEVHVGTFTPEGTFAGARAKLPYLKDLGVTAVELMPVADFPGRWNWGYDGAALFAPSRAYGAPDDLRGLVNEAHRLGLAVFLDVVYNHVGPDGAYVAAVNGRLFSQRHRTPWGAAINFDGEGSRQVRDFFIANALHWLREYHLDGLRLDATHAIIDEHEPPFLAELAAAAADLRPRRCLVAEDHRNLDRLVRPAGAGGFGLDAVWSDDYHHQMRRLVTGQSDGYFMDFEESAGDLATIIRRGWLYTGQSSRYFHGPRGTDPDGVPLWRFVHCVQNHDQVGNRPAGDRLADAVPLPVYRAVAALLLCGEALPLLFMGQEWGARTPFRYFTDHRGDLGTRVTRGRREEFGAFRGFDRDIPDPQDPETFHRSRLDWAEAARDPHARLLRLHRDLLAMRRGLAAGCAASSPAPGVVALRRGDFVLLAALRDGVSAPLPSGADVMWHSEQAEYAVEPHPPAVRRGGAVVFPVAAAVAARVRP